MAPTDILLIDDDERQRQFVADALHGLPVHIRTAADFHEGRRKMARRAPDMVLLDMHMPGVDGIQALRRIRGDPALRHLRVVMYTADGEDAAIEDAFAAGVDHYFLKRNSKGNGLREQMSDYLSAYVWRDNRPN